MAFCGILRDKGWYGAWFVLALDLFICEALDRTAGHFFSNHHRSCMCLGCRPRGRLRDFEASVSDSTACIVLLLFTTTPSMFFGCWRLLWCGSRTGCKH